MSTKWIKRLILVASTAISSISFAGTITDVVDLDDAYIGQFQTLSWTHNLNDNGFVLGSALSGILSVDLKDDSRSDGEELAYVTVERAWNFNDLFFNDDGFASIVLDFGTQLSASSLLRLNQNGLLDVTLNSVYGDFKAVDSTLTVRTAEVPEPTSLALLAAGMIGIVMMRRLSARNS